MITLTRLDGKPVCVNEINILWVEALPDTAVMMLGGGRILVKESVDEVKDRVNALFTASRLGGGAIEPVETGSESR